MKRETSRCGLQNFLKTWTGRPCICAFLLVTFFAFLSPVSAPAQTLSFSRVLSLIRTSSQADTVPAGKVWKLEHMAVGTDDKGYFQLRINGVNFYLFSEYGFGSSAFHAHTAPHGPMWFPAGTIISPSVSGFSYHFSIIEFSVVP